jgi:polyisoprenoid-binding protein YceI
MSIAPSTETIPNYVAGTWSIDPVHSDISFTVRHMMVSKVRGSFKTFGGTIVTAENPFDSKVNVTIDLGSLDTNNADRDAHIRSADFFNVDQHPQMTFESTKVAPNGEGFVVEGNLGLHGTTQPVRLDLEFNGIGRDPWGGTRIGFSATTELSRKEFGIDFNIPIDGGGVVVGDRVHVRLEVEAVLQPAAA